MSQTVNSASSLMTSGNGRAPGFPMAWAYKRLGWISMAQIAQRTATPPKN
jgi:hypothetical protein